MVGMRRSMLLLLLLVATRAGAMDMQAQESFDEKDVLELNGNNFQEGIKKFKFALVEFYAPWCGHCKNLAPEYAKAATELAEILPTESEYLGKLYGVEGFPTLKWFVGGVLYDKNPMVRRKEEIVRWVKKNSGPPANKIEDEGQLEELKKRRFSVVGFFQDEKSDEYKAFLEAAEEDQIYDYFVVHKPALAQQEGAKEPALLFYRDFDENKVVYDGKFDKSEILNAVKVHARLKDVIQIFLFNPNEKSLSAFKEASDLMQFRGKYIFAVIGEQVEQLADPEFATFIGAEKGKKESELFILNVQNMKKYRQQGVVTLDAIKNFLSDFENNKAPIFLKSSPVQEGWDKGVVKELASSQWKEFVNQAAEYFDDKYPGDVIFAKMDGTSNEAEDINVGGFPTVLAFPKGLKQQQPIDLSEKMRGLKDIVRTGEDAYEAAALRFKAAVKKLQGSLEPAAVQLNRAAEHIEKMVEAAKAKRQEL
ncbi:hypothetical protein GUITHDRAFT_109550 [Guillardia theta CCMP2712]|uniref:protein disulfide-isomerase n=1 Tax=Guillardia theta (strain CCMP2712) TaxID=905079 RepID=L1J8J8_GUITC|nr:hypothetical protein GUITHDRAFT_109550 [Guillardia theta CCMP2712]EKX44429.1 hypothetical protein GUITHDRAFT_109550 [Guillardia theta CCMP2712]|eukprot:XP_005831409.1 hypothetical protein GUITHDRAFT_109550 [Guillardia theta CCMP2712]